MKKEQTVRDVLGEYSCDILTITSNGQVLDRLRRFGTMIIEHTRSLYREIDSAAKQGYYRRG